MTDVHLTPEQFGIGMAKAIQERPYSSNWALAHRAVEIATGDSDMADAAYADMPEVLKNIVAQEKPKE